jgi:hypothetical protein
LQQLSVLIRENYALLRMKDKRSNKFDHIFYKTDSFDAPDKN